MSKTRRKKTPSHINTIRMLAGLALLVVIIAAVLAYLSQPNYTNTQEAQLAYLEGRYEDSVAAFTKAITQDSSNPEHYIGRAFTYLQLEQYDLARSDFEYAIALAPDRSDTRPYFELGTMALLDQDYETALGYFERIIELAEEGSPIAAEAYYNHGLTLSRQNNYPAALESFKLAVDYDPTIPKYLQRLGDTYYLLEQYGEALNTYEQYLSLQNPELVADYIPERVQALRGN